MEWSKQKKIYSSLTNGTNSHELLDIFNEVDDKNILAQINEFFMEEYNETTHEFISEKFNVDDVYAIDSTLKCIRQANQKNAKARDGFYAKIGYSTPS